MPLVEAARDMKPMDVGHVVWPDGSHMVFVLIELQPSRPNTFEESEGAAESSVRALRSETILKAMLDSLRAEHPVQIFAERLPQPGV